MWTKKISVGIEEIDNQHRKFISMINDAYDMVGNRNSSGLVKIAKDIVFYASIHFETEESMLKRWEYPLLAQHKKEHEKIFRDAVAFYDRIDREGGRALGDFLDFLKDWFNNHLSKFDMAYAEYYKEKGFIESSE